MEEFGIQLKLAAYNANILPKILLLQTTILLFIAHLSQYDIL